jgi:hypothetical protein
VGVERGATRAKERWLAKSRAVPTTLGEVTVRRLWRHYNLSVVLFGLFVLSLGLQTWMGWRNFASEQHQHGVVAHWLGNDGYIWAWGLATFQNWQSEFLQLLTFVVLTAYLVHRGSHESKDSDDRVHAQLDRIEQKLRAIEISAQPWVYERESRLQFMDRDSGI